MVLCFVHRPCVVCLSFPSCYGVRYVQIVRSVLTQCKFNQWLWYR